MDDKKKRKILIFAPDFYPRLGGYAHGITHMIRWLAQTSTYELHVITPVQIEQFPELNLPSVFVHRLPRHVNICKGINRIVYYLSVSRFLKNFFLKHTGFDFLFIETFEFPSITLRLVKYSKLPPAKIAIRIHACTETEIYLSASDRDLQRRFQQARKLASLTANILATTPYYLEYFKRYYCNYNIYLTDKNYGILPTFPPFPDNTDQTAKPTGELPAGMRDTHKLYFFALGRLNLIGYMQKNFELIAFALKHLEKTDKALFDRIVIATRGEGECLEKLETVIAALDLKNKFLFVPPLSCTEMQLIYKKASGAILISLFEGYSMFATEALSAGCPIILSSGTGVSHLVRNGENGYLADPCSPFDLARAISALAYDGVSMPREQIKTAYLRQNNPDNSSALFEYFTSVYACTQKPLRRNA